MKRSYLLLPVAVALTACPSIFAKGPHVPGDYEGPMKITIVNAWNHDLCAFQMWSGQGNNDNWLGNLRKQENLKPGQTRDYNIRPGTYYVLAGWCDGETAIMAVGGDNAGTRPIERSSQLVFGPTRVPPIAGEQTIAFTDMKPITQQEPVYGESAPEEQSEPAAESSSSSSSSSDDSSSSSSSSGPSCIPHGSTCSDGPPCCPGMACVSRTKFSDGSLGNGYCQ